MLKYLFVIILFLGCTQDKVVEVPGETKTIYIEKKTGRLEFNIWARLLQGGQGYYVVWWGDVRNVSRDTLKEVYTQAKLFFSVEALNADNPDIISKGRLGIYNFETGEFTPVNVIAPKQLLQHQTQSEFFDIPPNTEWIGYLFEFVSGTSTESVPGKFL